MVVAATALFACVTPLGILIGMGVGSDSAWTALVLNSLCAGTFLYIGLVESLTDILETDDKECHGSARDHVAAHVHHQHSPPPLFKRLVRFTVLVSGVVAIGLTQMADHDHDHGTEVHGH